MSGLIITSGGYGSEPAEAVVYPIFEDEIGTVAASGELPFEIAPYMAKRGETTWFFGRGGERHYLIVGLGRSEACTLERIREAAGIAGRALRKPGYRTVDVSLAFGSEMRAGESELVCAWTEGWLLGTYEFNRYRPNRTGASLERMHLLSDNGYKVEIERVRMRVDSIALARDLVNEPGDRLNPDAFVERIVARFAGTSVSIKVYRSQELVERSMNGLLTVGRGSRYSPALVELVYEPVPGEAPIALVGKGVTFDMGGMNAKTANDISDARMDMGGAAAVVGALDLLVRSGERRNVVALIPVVDNVPGPGAYLPSEVVSYPNGLTVQVKNTDAEGRLILADAMLHAAKFSPCEIIDVATLTGNVGQALGLGIAGMWGDEGMTSRLHAAGEKNGDRIWAMPLMDDYEEQLRSDYADLANWAPTPYGGAILAALFLRRFSGGLPWVHIVMANTSQAKSERGYYPVGASGYGVRLLADYLIGK
jgi:Leucyl aminopeptidase